SSGSSLPATFTVNPPPPTLTSLSPSSGAQGTAVPVTLIGSNFLPGASLTVSNPGITVSNLNVVSSSQITATFSIASNAATGSATVSVSTSGGSSSTVPFTVNLAPPVLSSINPSSALPPSPVPLTAPSSPPRPPAPPPPPDISVSNVILVTPSQIPATFTISPPAALGTFNVSVSPSAGTSAGLPFSIASAPVFNPIRINA